ncbi:MAG: hypothetical protein Q9213_000944 [Squamulea squamosa]
MGKRKRVAEDVGVGLNKVLEDTTHSVGTFKKRAKNRNLGPFTIQIIAGTYERVLHGISATISNKQDGTASTKPNVEFADTFLFNAHASAIRCLALSPPANSDKVTLASGSSDQTINIYHISARTSLQQPGPGNPLPSLRGRKIVENPKNKELGSLQHHAASINALKFPTRSKLLSASDDSTIGVARTRDWTILSSIKVPVPKAHGRPSGDTAPLGGTPAGVNDFAIHPSLKLMVSVSRGERCMRLWNLVTGKKAGVLNFDKNLLQAVGEGRWGRGEGLKVEWDKQGEEFVVSFEKAVVVFGLDSKPKGVIKTSPVSKIHQIHFVDLEVDDNAYTNILAVSTEDGRVIFFSTGPDQTPDSPYQIPVCPAIGQIGGGNERFGNRIKDFEYLTVQGEQDFPRAPLVVTGSSDGAIGVWSLHSLSSLGEFRPPGHAVDASNGINGKHGDKTTSGAIPEVGRLLSKYETGNRITCLRAFVLAETIHEEDDAPPITNDGVETNGDAEITSDNSSESA